MVSISLSVCVFMCMRMCVCVYLYVNGCVCVYLYRRACACVCAFERLLKSNQTGIVKHDLKYFAE